MHEKKISDLQYYLSYEGDKTAVSFTVSSSEEISEDEFFACVYDFWLSRDKILFEDSDDAIMLHDMSDVSFN